MAIDQRQIADIPNLVPQFVMDPLVAGTTPGITMEMKDDGKYHITLTLLQNVIDGKFTPETLEPDPKPDPSSEEPTAIDPSSLSLKTSASSQTYNGQAKTISSSDINGFDSTIMKLEGDTSKTAAGNYTVKVYLKDTVNYKWSDSRAATASVDLNWSIVEATPVVEPTLIDPSTIKLQERFKPMYSESSSATTRVTTFLDGYDSDYMTIDQQDVSLNQVGTITVKVSLTDTTHYGWTGTKAATDSVDISFTISKNDNIGDVSGNWGPATGYAPDGEFGSYELVGKDATREIVISRNGDGKVTATSDDTTKVTATVSNATSSTPKVTIKSETDVPVTNSDGINVKLKVDEGTYYMSSTACHESKSKVPESVNLKVRIKTKSLAEMTPAEIVAKVRSGEAAQMWQVGDVIPIELDGGDIVNAVNSTKESITGGEIYDTVIIGFDHNINVETPDVQHNMALALMKEHDKSKDNNICFYLKNVTALQLMGIATAQTMSHDILGNVNSYITKMATMYESIERIFPDAWRNVMIKTKKTFYGLTDRYLNNKIFFLTPYEAASTQGAYMIDAEKGTQQRYKYFYPDDSAYSLIAAPRVKKVKAIMHTADSAYNDYPVHILSRTVDASYQFVTVEDDYNDAYSYAKKSGESTRKWQKVGLDTIYEYNNIGTNNYSYSEIGFGIIPCFNIG